jgi:uncharacterized peroxidase-related enzyme
MARLQPIDLSQAQGKVKTLLDGVQATLGITPNMMRAMAQAPAVLQGYLSFSAALAGGTLRADLRERLALAVAEANRCQYCLAAHTALGERAGLGAADRRASRQATADDPKVDAALKFARLLVVRRGEVSDQDVQRLKDLGYGDGEIAEIVANVALNILTNTFNNVADTPIDFPAAEPLEAAAG